MDTTYCTRCGAAIRRIDFPAGFEWESEDGNNKCQVSVMRSLLSGSNFSDLLTHTNEALARWRHKGWWVERLSDRTWAGVHPEGPAAGVFFAGQRADVVVMIEQTVAD